MRLSESLVIPGSDENMFDAKGKDSRLNPWPLGSNASEGWQDALLEEHPQLLASLGTDKVGVVIVDDSAKVLTRWGLANSIDFLQVNNLANEHRLTGLIQAAFRAQTGSVLIENFRVHAGTLSSADGYRAVLLVTDAKEESEAKRKATISEKKAEALKRIGKALTMHQTLQPMAVAAVHAISTATEAAAVLLWIQSSEDSPMELAASVGANRQGTTALSRLDTIHGMSCAAELTAVRKKPLILQKVTDNPVTESLEAKFCYLAPGGLMIWPLMIGGRLVGLLEIISREDDHAFVESSDLYMTIAEHLALALNSAFMFESVEKLAAFDPLTGIANHRTMQEFLHRRVLEAERSQGTIGAIMIDVDHFRKFNEEEGHDAGDKVLKMVSDVLRACVRPYDLAARYGGEEFTVIMPGVLLDQTLNVAERIRTEIEKLSFVSASGVEKRITASLGCSVYPENAKDSASLLKAADLALYEVKRTTRNRVEAYGGMMSNERSESTMTLLKLTRSALPDKIREETETFLRLCRGYIGEIVRAARLAPSQAQILEAACLLLPYWLRVKGHQDRTEYYRLKKIAELEEVLNCVTDIEERFDGNGPEGKKGTEILLLSRILAILNALCNGDTYSLSKDVGKFDPQLMHIFSEIERVA